MKKGGSIMQVLIVEDEKRLAKALKQILTEQKYMVDMVHDGRDGLDYAMSGIYDVIILDVMLPYRDGFEIAYELRKNKIETPILMLTAKDTVPDKVSGLNSGADDYMTKPFAPEELLARIKALTRRRGEVMLDETGFGDFSFNASTSELSRGAKSVRLNFKEAEILKLLLPEDNNIIYLVKQVSYLRLFFLIRNWNLNFSDHFTVEVIYYSSHGHLLKLFISRLCA